VCRWCRGVESTGRLWNGRTGTCMMTIRVCRVCMWLHGRVVARTIVCERGTECMFGIHLAFIFSSPGNLMRWDWTVRDEIDAAGREHS
jgi:hypothetical protein